MRVALATLIAVSFISIAVLGVFGPEHGMDHGHGCIAETAAGAMCPDSPLQSAIFHLETFRSFSTAVLVGFAAGLLALAALFSLWLRRQRETLAAGRYFSAHNYREFFQTSTLERFISWLALHENSPSVA